MTHIIGAIVWQPKGAPRSVVAARFGCQSFINDVESGPPNRQQASRGPIAPRGESDGLAAR
ncbi:hypothetical protein Pma05_20590 [Plantactinospora mayteni]|uniref:Uncharacterized protein n=1 Tax=Plantactinospora mayteni TaxID=566021 RepID=A0ABQ4EL93_9ACTN|nr:hypothetical protein Pma05_20590 [Plantactinospora mayteni]